MMIKKALSFAACIILICSLMTSCGLSYSAPEDGAAPASVTDAPKKIFESVTYEIEDGQAVITGCVEEATDRLTIPGIIEGCPVTAIDSFAFRDRIKLTGVSIPESVTSIGEGAFYGCTGIRSIDIPDTIINIGHNAFLNTAYYNFKTSWDGKVLYAGNHLIYAKRSIEGDYTVREGTVSIADNAFSDTEEGYCTELKSISLPSSLRYIGRSAFEYCEGLSEIIIPDGVIRIGAAAFRECTGLKSVTLPDSAVDIGENAFVYTDYSNDMSNWEDGVLYIGNHLIKAEDSVSETYTVRPGTVSIAGSAFSYCGGLEGIIIPETVTALGEGVFTGCDNLGGVYYEGTQTAWDSVLNAGQVPDTLIHYEYGKEPAAATESLAEESAGKATYIPAATV